MRRAAGILLLVIAAPIILAILVFAAPVIAVGVA
jgi:hypothetical protein